MTVNTKVKIRTRLDPTQQLKGEQQRWLKDIQGLTAFQIFTFVQVISNKSLLTFVVTGMLPRLVSGGRGKRQVKWSGV